MNSNTKTETFIRELGLEAIPEPERSEILAEIGEVVFTAAMQKVWNVLDSKQQDELLALFELSTQDPKNKEKQEAVQSFIDEYVPNFKKYIHDEQEAIIKVQKEIYTEIT